MSRLWSGDQMPVGRSALSGVSAEPSGLITNGVFIDLSASVRKNMIFSPPSNAADTSGGADVRSPVGDGSAAGAGEVVAGAPVVRIGDEVVVGEGGAVVGDVHAGVRVTGGVKTVGGVPAHAASRIANTTVEPPTAA
ncbi:MAG: hypothetical protein ABIP53_00110 [Candidatus Limnocylindrales bacterium]